jgi:hypothetical protein
VRYSEIGIAALLSPLVLMGQGVGAGLFCCLLVLFIYRHVQEEAAEERSKLGVARPDRDSSIKEEASDEEWGEALAKHRRTVAAEDAE